MARSLSQFDCEGGLDYRRRLIELDIPLGKAAASMEVTANYLSAVLRGREPLRPKMRLRIEQYLKEREKRKGARF